MFDDRHVYVMCSKDGRTKIGVSMNVEKRKRQLEAKNGCLSIVYCSPLCENAFMIEKACHESFKDYSIGSEWFDIDGHVVAERVMKIFNEMAHTDNSHNRKSSGNQNYEKCVKSDHENRKKPCIGTEILDIYNQLSDIGKIMVITYLSALRDKEIADSKQKQTNK